MIAVTVFLACNLSGQTIEEISKLFVDAKYDEVIGLCTAGLKSDSNNTDLNQLLGQSLAEKGQYHEAIPFLGKVVADVRAVAWQKAWSLGYLGTCYYLTGRPDKSKESLTECVKINATKFATEYGSDHLSLFGFSPWSKDRNIKHIDALYGKKKYDEVIAGCQVGLKEDPRNVQLQLMAGRSLADKGDVNAAIPYLEQVIAGDKSDSWIKGWALGYAGDCYYTIGRYDKSKELLTECVKINATENSKKYASRRLMMFGFDKSFDSWGREETEHLVFHIHPLVYRSVYDIKAYVKSREQAYAAAAAFFGSTLPKRIDCLVWPSPQALKETYGSPAGFATPVYCIVNSWCGQTAGHEITHVVSHYCTDHIVKTPLINEGAAVFLDGTGRDRLDVARDAVKKNGASAVSIKDNWNAKVMPDELYYPISGAFVAYLNEIGGRDNFLALFKNQTYESAKQIYGDKTDSLITDFEKSLFQ